MSGRYLKPGFVLGRLVNPVLMFLRVCPTLAVRGRTSGEWRTVPVNVLDVDGRRYLVAPRGDTQWARNLRVAGGGELRTRKGAEAFRAIEIDDPEKPPLIEAYVARWGSQEVAVPGAPGPGRPPRLPHRAHRLGRPPTRRGVTETPQRASAAAPMACEPHRRTLDCNSRAGRSGTMRKALEIGGIVAAAVLIAFGIAAIVMGSNGRSTVDSSLKQEQIYGTPDMSPKGISAEAAAAQRAQDQLFGKLHAAGVQIKASPITIPSCTVAGQFVDNGDKARCFAQYMRIHTFGATSGLTYSQMGRYVAQASTPLKYTDGLGATNDPKYAALDPQTKQPVNNGRRDLWVTYTALTTALNTSYMASQIALFGIVVGIALLLSGIGFGILAVSGAVRSSEPAFTFMKKWTHKDAPAVPAA